MGLIRAVNRDREVHKRKPRGVGPGVRCQIAQDRLVVAAAEGHQEVQQRAEEIVDVLSLIHI